MVKDQKKVFVGLSGGVDSATTAALLKKEGYFVVGVFIKVWSPDWLPCTWPNERRDAMRVTASLDIPFLTLDLEKEYRDNVAHYMINEYKEGRTPNPDVMCNKEIKFGSFYDWAIKEGADYVATGHYARIKNGKLLRGVDKNKDQSYFLWNLKKDQLDKVLLPIGEYNKEDVRKLAKKLDVPVFDKRDSQGVCFLGKLDMKDFLKHYIDSQKGDVLNENGEIIGEHDGALFYTLGQRHGFSIIKKTNEDKPMYIVGRSLDKNTITVSEKGPEEILKNADVILKDVNWISDLPDLEKDFQAQVRYRQLPQSCRGVVMGEVLKLSFKKPQILNSGQSAVMYDGDVCLGGGVIS